MIERRVLPSGAVRWRVRYYGPDRRERSKSFARRVDAQAYESEVSVRKRRGDWVDPQRGRVTLAQVWDEYQRTGTGHLRETTKTNYRYAWAHVSKGLGGWPVVSIEHADVAEWVASMSSAHGPDTVRRAHLVLCLVLDHAMRSRRVPVNVARGVRLPARPPARERILSVEEVDAVVSAMPTDRDVVLAMVYLGLRWSELAGLRVADVSLARRRVTVVERATEIDGRMDVDRPKSKAGHRSIGVPQLLMEPLAVRVEGKGPGDLVFPSPEGTYLRLRNWRRRSGFDVAVRSAGLDATPHDLRRTFGSLARMAGADLRYIQKAMGHESITTTARIYAHLYDDELDTVAAALNRVARGEAGR
ncbi:MAG: tyrosine-type recombinase/integrase [Dermatophilaceae bacterium]